jgi:YD repeat-containing protein
MATLASPLDVANGIAAIHSRLDLGNNIELKGDAFTLASVSVQPPAGSSLTNAFSASAPRILSKALRLSRNSETETWLEMRALGTRDTAQGAVEQDAVVYRAADVDLDVVLSLGSSRLEELRVLRSAKAATTARYALEVAPGMQLRALDGRIEALDRTGRVAFRTNAAFAVDSAGTMRSVELRLEGNELSTSFDSSGLKYPVVVDPEWVTGPTWPHEAVLAQNSIELSSGGAIVGDATVIQRSSGTFLGSLAPAQLDSGAQLTGALSADSVRLQSGSVIAGDAHFNTLSGPGLVRGERFLTLALPVPVSAPNFPAFTVGTQDVMTSVSAPLQLAAGNYRNLNLKSGTTLSLTGGAYAFSSISFGSGSRFECLAACDVRLLGRFVEASGGFFGPAAGATIGADQVEVFVSSANGSSSLTAIPAVALSSGSTIRGRFFAPNGTISVASGAPVVGTLVGRDVLLSSGAQVVKDNPTTPTCTANDNNPCTQDSCNAAGQPVFTPLPAGTSCADGNACNGAEACNGAGVCSPGAPPVIDDGNPRTTDSCDPTSGVTHTVLAAGTSCSDGNACNGAEICNGTSQCTPGTPPVVDDGNPCTADSCDPKAGVTHQPVAAGTSCSDGNPCNGAETCNASATCVAGAPPSLDDGNPCTKDSCDPSLGVQHIPAPAGTSCSDGDACNGSETCGASGTCTPGSPPVLDDGNPCTADSCDPTLGVVHLPLSGTSCSDGNACNGSELCQAGACAAGAPPVLDDGNPCTADECDPVTGVTHTAVANGTSCSDGNACNGAEICAAGTCAAGTPTTVDDGNPCTADSCDPKTGVKHVPVASGTSCSDGNACNGAEACNGAGVCSPGVPPVIDDGNPCTTDSCDPTSGVTHMVLAAGTSCSDGNACNGAEICNSTGTCTAGTLPTVDDGNPCTADSCDAATGVVHTPTGAGTSCSDGNVCNGTEQCNGSGTCAAGTPLVVDDGNPCTTDSCDPISGAKHALASDGTSCADGNACNGNETCQQGSCAAGTPPVLDDKNACTADSCDPALGVVHAPVTFGTSCSDGNPCNGAEICSGFGQCGAGTPPVLDDGNPCTADACDPTLGVTHMPAAAGLSCADGNVCNGDERCDAVGNCMSGTALPVDDGDSCTTDSCDPINGVEHSLIPGCVQGGVPGQPFETRASIMGRVINADGSPVTTFNAEVFNDTLDSGPRGDVQTTVNPDGTFRIRLLQFPLSVADRAAPQHILIQIEDQAFPSLLRSAYLHPCDVVALGDMTVLQRDSNVTMIGPEGGTAQDSQRTLSLEIPPGALAQTTPVRLTPIPSRAQFPAPLPSNTVTTYGMEIEPSGVVLSMPATLRVKNTLNLPTTMQIPVGTIDPRYGDWTHEGFATWDGTRFSTTISHFSPHDVNGARLGELFEILQDGSSRNKNASSGCVGSAVEYSNGSLEQAFDVPLEFAAGHDYSLSLNYTSELSGGVMVGSGPSAGAATQQSFFHAFSTQGIRVGCAAPAGGSCSGSGSGGVTPPCRLASNASITIPPYNLNQHVSLFGSDVDESQSLPANTQNFEPQFYVPLPSDDSGNPPRSGYAPLHITSNVTVGGSGTCVGGGAGFGVAANVGANGPLRLPIDSGDLLDFPTYQLVVQRRGSPMGSGWAFSDLGTLYRTPDGASADIVHGNGQQETFHPYPFVNQVAALQNTNSGDDCLAVDTQTGEVFDGRSVAGIQRVDVQAATITTAASGTLFGGRTPTDLKVTYVAGARRFLATTAAGVFEIGSDGTSRQLATFASGPATRLPVVAGVGKYLYFASDSSGSGVGVDSAIISRIDLTDPNRTVVNITPATGGDMRLDTHGEVPAQGFQFLHPTGLAAAFDGGLYVADDRRQVIYHLAADDVGEVGPNSIVTRVLGSGVDTLIGGLGRNMPALDTAIRAPGRLAVAPDGVLYVSTSAQVGGLLAFDPIAQTGHWLAFDGTSSLGTTDAVSTLAKIAFGTGSLAPLSGGKVILAFTGYAFQLTTPLSSQYEPLRTLTFSDTGATVVDAAADITEQYNWITPAKGEAQLVGESHRSGEPIRTIAYKDMDRVDYIQDAAGGRIGFAYDNSGHLSSVTDAAQRVTHFNVDSDGNLREVIYPSGEARRFDYQDFRMTSSTHPDGQVSTYTYAPDGTLQTATRPGGGTTTVESGLSRGPQYDALGRTFYESLITDDRGVQHALSTNAAGAVFADRYTADGQAYDVENLYAGILLGTGTLDASTNRLLRFSNTTINGLPVGPVTTFDTYGRPLKVTQSPTDATLKLTQSYDATQRLAKLDFGVTSIDWGYTYDTSGHLTKVADQVQGVETGRRITYGGFRVEDGQPTAITSHSVPTTLGYDAFGLVNSAVDSLGRSLTTTHDAAGNILTQSDGATSVSYGHDDAGRVVSVTDALNNTTTLSYESAGCSCSNGDRVTSITTPDLPAGERWALTYDADGDLQTATSPLGEVETYSHNAQRDLVGVTDRAGRPTTFSYDQLGRQATVTDAIGRVGVFNYALPTASSWSGPTIYAQSASSAPAPSALTDALSDGQYQVGINGVLPGADRSHVALYRDATFQTSQWIRADALDRAIQRQDRSASGLAFDSTTPMPSSSDPPFVDERYDDGTIGSPWALPFNEDTKDAYQNRFWEAAFTRNPDFDLTQFSSGFLGLIPTQTLGTDPLVMARDVAGRLTGVTLGNSNSALAVSSIGYQPNGKVSSVAIQTPSMVLDPNGDNCQISGDPVKDASICQFGSCSATKPGVNGNCPAYRLKTTSIGEGFQYDTRGLLGTRTMTNGTAQYSYDAVGRNTTLVYPDGHQRTQMFDALGRLTSRCYLYNDGSPEHCYTATYDAVGNPKILTDPDMRQEITYDDLDRVTQVQRFVPATATVSAYTETYAYNALGAFSVYDGVAVDDHRPRLSGGGTASAGIPATYAGVPVVQDAGGRVTSYNGQTFQYFNFHHHLETYSSSIEKQSFAYDGLERLTSVHFDLPSIAANNPDQLFAYIDAGPSIAAIVQSPHAAAPPPHPPDILDTSYNVGYDGVDHPLWLSLQGGEQYVYFYTELDCVGNVRHLHSDAAGKPGQALGDRGGYSYSAFGKLLRGSDPGALSGGVPLFGWQGKRVLSVLQPNLYDSRARVWSADLGAFLQPDEYVFLTRTGTLWSWPGQNPYRWRDPSGRDASEWFLRNADGLQAGAEAISGAAIVIATGGLAGEVLGFGSLDATLGALGLSAASGAGSIAVSSGAAATTAVVANAAGNECSAIGEAAEAAAEGAESLAFSQTTASAAFSAEGSFAGKTIGGLAGELRSGAVAASDVPVKFVNIGGNSLIVNTRSSLALMRAGIPQSGWTLINATATDAASIEARLLSNGLTVEGTSTLRITGLGSGASSLR